MLATTKDAASKAVGLPVESELKGRTCTLAVAVSTFHTTTEARDRGKAIDKIHRIVLEVGDHLVQTSYCQYLAKNELDPGAWRPRIIQLARAMEYSAARFTMPDAWLDHARIVLSPFVAEGGGSSIRRRLPSDGKLTHALAAKNSDGLTARTIHSVKGHQFPAVCVVMPPLGTKAILDQFETGRNKDDAEDVRKLYVAVSRAERLLIIAVPKSQMARLKTRLNNSGVVTVEHKV